jgi:hypothetical protein
MEAPHCAPQDTGTSILGTGANCNVLILGTGANCNVLICDTLRLTAVDTTRKNYRHQYMLIGSCITTAVSHHKIFHLTSLI